MIYLDYSANFPVKEEVLKELVDSELGYVGNINSTHCLGLKSLDKYKLYDNEIHNLLKLNNDYEIVYTSSATEANNLAIKGICEAYSGFGKKILVSELEHNSINATLGYLKTAGYDVEFIKTNSEGIDYSDLRSKMSKDVILVITILVESETGLINDVKKVSDILIDYPNAHHLVDSTQGITKIDFDLNGLDLITFTPHKFGGLTGTGVLVKKKTTILTPLIHGGLSQTVYRSGSTPLGLIATIYKSLQLAFANKDDNYNKTKAINDYLLNELRGLKNVRINSFKNPYIVNISIKGIKSKDIVEYLSGKEICVSQKSACSIKNTPSKTIMVLYADKARALESFRISLCELTTKEDIDTLIKAIREYK